MSAQLNNKPVTSAHTDLFQPYALGPLTLANRIVMAPLTRSRALEGDIPGPLAVTYYTQRASAGLIISEASQISQQGKGYARTPGIYSAEQVAGWREVTEAVHTAGGKIFLQLWHVGRISHPEFQPGGGLPVAPSAIKPEGMVHTSRGKEEMVTPRALETTEIPGIVADYRNAAQNAREAGFDGVEIHAANGYLLDQFLRNKTNQRQDVYGGSIQNRSRFLLEVSDAILSVWSPECIGVRLSPLSTFGDIDDSDPMQLYSYLVQQLAARKLGYLHMIEGNTGGPRDTGRDFDFHALRRSFPNTYLANNCYTRDMALAALESNAADLIAFGRPFISNPDLVARLRDNAPLNELDPSTLYGGDEHGYTDYPFLNQ